MPFPEFPFLSSSLDMIYWRCSVHLLSCFLRIRIKGQNVRMITYWRPTFAILQMNLLRLDKNSCQAHNIQSSFSVSSSNACQLLILIQHLQAESNFSWTVGAAYITRRQKESLRAFQQLFTFFAGNHIYSAEETIPEPRVCCHFFASRGPPIKNPL